MNFKPQLLVPCALLSLQALAAAFQSQPPVATSFPDVNPLTSPWTRTWTGGPTIANTRKAVSGDFTGDLTPDVWQQTTTRLELFLNPSYMDYGIDFPITTSSIARLPAVAPLTKDRLLIADAVGLSILEATLDPQNPLITKALSVPSSWANAKSLCCADLNLDGKPDIMAIRADGAQLLRLLDNGANGYTALSDINLGSGAYEAFPMVYNVGQPPQFAVLTPTWMFIVQPSGVRSRLFPTNTTVPGHIAKISEAPGGVPLPDGVAWLRDITGAQATQEIAVIDSRTALQPRVQLYPIYVSTIFSGDVNADGSDELGLFANDSKLVYTYFNQHSDPNNLSIDRFANQYATAASIAGQVSLPPGSSPTPLLADMNFDRKADLFTIDSDNGVVLSIQTDPLIPGQYFTAPDHPCFNQATFYTANYLVTTQPGNCNGTPGPADKGELMLTLGNPWQMPTTMPALAGWKLELTMYRQEIAPALVTPLAVAHYEYPLDDPLHDYHVPGTQPGSGGLGEWTFPITIDSNASEFQHKYYIIVRPLRPAPLAPLTEYVTGFTADLQTPLGTGPYGGAYPYLLNRPSAWPASIRIETYNNSANICSAYQSKIERRGVVPQAQPPRFTGNLPPNPGPVQTPPAPVVHP